MGGEIYLENILKVLDILKSRFLGTILAVMFI